MWYTGSRVLFKPLEATLEQTLYRCAPRPVHSHGPREPTPCARRPIPCGLGVPSTAQQLIPLPQHIRASGLCRMRTCSTGSRFLARNWGDRWMSSHLYPVLSSTKAMMELPPFTGPASRVTLPPGTRYTEHGRGYGVHVFHSKSERYAPMDYFGLRRIRDCIQDRIPNVLRF